MTTRRVTRSSVGYNTRSGRASGVNKPVLTRKTRRAPLGQLGGNEGGGKKGIASKNVISRRSSRATRRVSSRPTTNNPRTSDVAPMSEDETEDINSVDLGDALDDVMDVDLETPETDGIEEQISAIDAKDARNPQYVTEYVPEIMEHFRKTESLRQPSAHYMAQQSDINARMRTILVDWLIEVHLKFKLKPDTMYLTVNLIDRFLQRTEVSRSKLQLVGCTAMLLASKYEEIYAPEVRDFVYISDKAYTREQILKMELIMCNALRFNLTVPTPYQFSLRFLKIADKDETVRLLTNFLMELCLVNYSMLSYIPSEIAAACLYNALRMTRNTWTPVLERVTTYSEKRVLPCAQAVHALLVTPNPKEKAVRKKYMSSKFGRVAKIQPPTHL